MVVFIEYILLISIITHLVSTKYLRDVFRVDFSLFTEIIGVSFCFIQCFLYLFKPEIYIYSFYIYPIIISLLYSKNESLKRFVYIISLLLILNTLIIGFSEVISIVDSLILNYLLSIAIVIFVLELLLSLLDSLQINEFKYQIYIRAQNKVISLIGFLDTGNFLTDTRSRLPIIVVNNKCEKIGNFKKNLVINLFNKLEIIELYQVDEININIGGKTIKRNALVAYYPIKFDALVGLRLINNF